MYILEINIVRRYRKGNDAGDHRTILSFSETTYCVTFNTRLQSIDAVECYLYAPRYNSPIAALSG